MASPGPLSLGKCQRVGAPMPRRALSDQRMSLRKISAELALRGHLTANGRPYVATAVQTMLART